MSKISYKPTGARIIVERQPADVETQSGIFIPDSAQEKPYRGIVSAVGPGRVTSDGKTIPVNVKEGDTVIYGQYSGTNIQIDDSEYLILKESEILAVKI
ncbi:MAG: co-chaperone GroES [bacterium]|nr:co-chaperone GroES [bacterium]